MSDLDLTAPGVDVLARSLVDAGALAADLVDPNRRAGTLALEAADIPRRTGRLADGATVAATADGFTLSSTAAYGGYVHARDPFFSRALEQQLDAITGVYVDHVTDALSTVRGA